MGRIFSVRGDHQQAEKRFRQAFKIFKKTKGIRQVDEGLCHFYMGKMCYAQGNYEQTIKSLKQALDIYNNALLPLHPRVVEIWDILGAVFKDQGRKQEKNEAYRFSKKIRAKLKKGENFL